MAAIHTIDRRRRVEATRLADLLASRVNLIAQLTAVRESERTQVKQLQTASASAQTQTRYRR